jgi:hypothetical protein
MQGDTSGGTPLVDCAAERYLADLVPASVDLLVDHLITHSRQANLDLVQA